MVYKKWVISLTCTIIIRRYLKRIKCTNFTFWTFRAKVCEAVSLQNLSQQSESSVPAVVMLNERDRKWYWTCKALTKMPLHIFCRTKQDIITWLLVQLALFTMNQLAVHACHKLHLFMHPSFVFLTPAVTGHLTNPTNNSIFNVLLLKLLWQGLCGYKCWRCSHSEWWQWHFIESSSVWVAALEYVNVFMAWHEVTIFRMRTFGDLSVNRVFIFLGNMTRG